MSRSKHDDSDPEAHELTAAVGDVAYRLTHDLSDTPEDIRDALAFAPLATVKFLRHLEAKVRRRPKTAIALATVLAVGIGLIAAGLQRRSGNTLVHGAEREQGRRDRGRGGRRPVPVRSTTREA